VRIFRAPPGAPAWATSDETGDAVGFTGPLDGLTCRDDQGDAFIVFYPFVWQGGVLTQWKYAGTSNADVLDSVVATFCGRLRDAPPRAGSSIGFAEWAANTPLMPSSIVFDVRTQTAHYWSGRARMFTDVTAAVGLCDGARLALLEQP
jgi:hypothetical protein